MIANQIKCDDVGPEMLQQITEAVEIVLKRHSKVKGYHGLEFWATLDSCILELHVFFEGSMNIAEIHKYVTELEEEIREELGIDNLDTIFLHSEPSEGRPDGIIFEEIKDS
jgi:divalent metal cation (Fe/Co/Zn/Cd) transporter